MVEDGVSDVVSDFAAKLNRLAKEDPQVATALLAVLTGHKPPKRYVKQYTPPAELTLNGIPTTVVDPHNEALYYWVRALREQDTSEPALLVHVDDHSDLYRADAQITDIIGPGRNLTDAPLDQIWALSQHLDVAAFIEPAVVDDILLPTVFWYQPYTRTMGRYHYNPGSPKAKAMDFILFSERKVPPYSFSEVPDGPQIWDIDLDAFSCLERRADSHDDIDKRIETTERVLSAFGKKPVCITLATSQTPERYLRKRDIGYVTEQALNMLERITR